jgi:hypothetical protein
VGLTEISTTMAANPLAGQKARNWKSILIKKNQMLVVHNIFNTFVIITKAKTICIF